ncbi:protein kinase superfamily protein [Striga asiatica]|uniref:Protein kinase superfamily protein n=1 Tax=Striga asiatica TaxID=4170 RepID=A0A5A7QHQ8_STRAF|nr:protein kinase superfamily protein [Striga asiatica]
MRRGMMSAGMSLRQQSSVMMVISRRTAAHSGRTRRGWTADDARHEIKGRANNDWSLMMDGDGKDSQKEYPPGIWSGGDLGSPIGGPPVGSTGGLPGLQRSEPGHAWVCVPTAMEQGVLDQRMRGCVSRLQWVCVPIREHQAIDGGETRRACWYAEGEGCDGNSEKQSKFDVGTARKRELRVAGNFSPLLE